VIGHVLELLILNQLKRDPNSHWLLARLALTHYEEDNYEKALELEIKGLNIAPACPLLCWGYAGSCSMLGKNQEALAVYNWLIKRGVDNLAYGECGEGHGWARALIADVHYRAALCYEALGDSRKARTAIKKHLKSRGPGCRSIYSIREARKIAKRLGVAAA
jgi:tetratricopeptide (TPR) repeat protein